MEDLVIEKVTYIYFYNKPDHEIVWICKQRSCPVKVITTSDRTFKEKIGKHIHQKAQPRRSLLQDYKKIKDKCLSEKDRVKKILTHVRTEKKKCDFKRKLRESLLRTNFLSRAEEMLFVKFKVPPMFQVTAGKLCRSQ